MAEEKIFENKIKRLIQDLGGWHVKYFANRMTKKGIPDILACISGYFVAIEVKAQNGKPTDLQMYHAIQIRKSGGFSFVVYPSGFEQLKVFLTGLKNGYFDTDLPIILK